MISIVLALAFAAQTQPTQPTLIYTPPAHVPTPANDIFFQDTPPPSSEARRAMQGFGACVADRSPDLAANTLRRDFTTQTYRSNLSRLGRMNGGCLRGASRMAGAGVLFAGALAEGLLKRDSEPLNVRLARAAQQPATPAHSPSDAVAICVVRSLPDETARLFATEAAGDEEAAAALALAPAVSACAQPGRQVRASDAGLRAILATAAYRSIHGSTGDGMAQRD